MEEHFFYYNQVKIKKSMKSNIFILFVLLNLTELVFNWFLFDMVDLSYLYILQKYFQK